MPSIRHVSIVLCAVLGMSALPARAQTPRPERPYRGVFANPGQRGVPVLTWHTSLGLGYDDNVLEGDGELTAADQVDLRSQPSAFWSGSTSLRYAMQKDRVSANVVGSSQFSYYGALPAPSVPSYGLGLDLSVELGASTALSLGEQLSYQPLYFLPEVGGIPPPQLGELPLPDPSSGARVDNRLTTLTSLGVVQDVSDTVTLEARGSYQRTGSLPRAPGLERAAGGIRLGVGLSRSMTARIGVSVSEATYAGELQPERFRSRDLDAGIDFNRPLSLSRRTSLTFGTGLSTIVPAQGETRYFLLGHVAIAHETGRTWTTQLQYRREVSYSDVFRAPVLADRVSASFAGMPSRTVRLATSAGASVGDVGVAADATGNGFRNIFGTGDVIVALSRHVGVGANYTYYRYRFDDNVALLQALPRDADRHRASVYLSFWVPLASINRSNNAAR